MTKNLWVSAPSSSIEDLKVNGLRSNSIDAQDAERVEAVALPITANV